MAILRTETEMFLRYDGTEGGTATFTTLSGIDYYYNKPGRATEAEPEETLTFPAISDVVSYVTHPGDALYIVGSFDVNDDFTVTVNSLSTVFYYELFLWRFCYARMVKLKGTEL